MVSLFGLDVDICITDRVDSLFGVDVDICVTDRVDLPFGVDVDICVTDRLVSVELIDLVDANVTVLAGDISVTGDIAEGDDVADPIVLTHHILLESRSIFH